MKIERIGIKKQILYVVLGCSLITLIIAGGIALFGMMKIKSNAVKIGVNIGETAAEKSTQALKETTLEGLQGLAYERSKKNNKTFE